MAEGCGRPGRRRRCPALCACRRRAPARTTVYLLRLRSQLAMETLEGNRVRKRRDLLAEECLSVSVLGGNLGMLTESEAARLVAAEPARNMVPEQRQRQIERALAELPGL